MRERERLSAENKELTRLLTASAHALRSYEKGNSSPDLARSVAAEAELYLSRFASGGSERLLGVTAESEALTPLGDEVLLIPAVMTPAVAEILGTMIMTTCPIAHALRTYDGAQIRRKTEDEQAFVMHWFLRLAAEHGDGWREKANAHLHSILPRPERASEASEGRA